MNVAGYCVEGMDIPWTFSKNSPPMGRLGSGPYVVGRLGWGMRVSVSFQLR